MLENKWIPLKHRTRQPDGKGLSDKQVEFLCLICPEALYGGAAGGGKSDALLMAALMFVDIPEYSAIIFRKSYTDLTKANALIDRSHQWLDGTQARWDGTNHTWTFPSGAKLSFGYIETDKDVYHHQSAEYQYEGFDELTQFTEYPYRYMFSRLRRLEGSDVPLRMRAASNPGNIGHDWVKQRFMTEGATYGRVFIPAKLDDNPNLDQKQYVESLSQLDPITRKQYLNGDWTARHGGSIFLREWFEIIGEAPADCRKVRYWDLAATKPKDNTDPDYTVGTKLGIKNGIYYVMDVRRVRAAPPQVEALIKQTAELDKLETRIFMEQEPGSSGVNTVDYYSRQVLTGYSFWGVKTTGPKEERAVPVSSAAEAGNVKLVRAVWNSVFLDEFEAFPLGIHDDIVDATSGAFQQLKQPTANPSFLLK